ncbi:uncharacterized protein LOC110849778 [Folsomia candida]|uniref:uncharacterized protein LOC110849778 n=1 Tax=Folsomia candida TaxID=158441 RepID=UPI000B8F61BC|nr:uncharacterized protein LOC110849778 [Folsomia candida]
MKLVTIICVVIGIFGIVEGVPLESNSSISRQDGGDAETVMPAAPEEAPESLIEVGNLFNNIFQGLKLIPVAAAHALKQQQNATQAQNGTTTRRPVRLPPPKTEVVLLATQKPPPRRVVQYLPAPGGNPVIVYPDNITEDPDDEDDDARRKRY